MKWRRGKKIKNNHVEKIEHKMQKERKKLCTKEMKQKREKKKEKKCVLLRTTWQELGKSCACRVPCDGNSVKHVFTECRPFS